MQHEASLPATTAPGKESGSFLLVKKPYLEGTRSAAEIALMRSVRKAFDPLGLMNPGKVFD